MHDDVSYLELINKLCAKCGVYVDGYRRDAIELGTVFDRPARAIAPARSGHHWCPVYVVVCIGVVVVSL